MNTRSRPFEEHVPGSDPTFILAGGGTGGHLFPALAIADELKNIRPGARFLFVGTKNRIEARVVPQRGYDFTTLWISGFRRSFSPENILFPLKVLVALVQSFFVIRRVKPNAVIGTGGYVCGPILFTAAKLGIPTVIHESNSYPGMTTRLLSGKVSKVFLGFEEARRWLKNGDHLHVVGTPTRDSLDTASRTEALTYFGLDPGRKTVLIIGGSHGASSINNAILAMSATLQRSDIQLIWQTGTKDLQTIQKSSVQPAGWIGSFIDRMDLAYAAADLVVARAGATTIAELTRIGKPAVLVPYPHAAEQHQVHNATMLVDAGAAAMVLDAEVHEKLEPVLYSLVNNQAVLEGMTAAGKRLGRPEAARVIAENILALVK